MTTQPDTGHSEAEVGDVGEVAERLLRPQRLGRWAASCPDIPEGFLVPMGWKCDQRGIWKEVERRRGRETETVEIRMAFGAILPIASHIATNGDQFIELVWWDGLRWTGRMVPRAVAKAGKKLIAVLGDAGLPTIEGNARDLEHWLAAAEALNRRIIPEHKIARRLGWQPDGTFIASPDDARVEAVYPEQEAALAAHRRRGTFAGWQAGMRHIERLPVAKLALYAGLAAPMLDVLRISSFTIDFSGRSTRGKTTAAKIGLSCWADPASDGDAIYTWQTTQLAMEKRLNLVQGLPVLIDDTRVARNPEDVDAALYHVSVGHGKPRAQPWPSLLPWSTIVISTGEQPALSFTTHQGASARVISITQPPFGRGEEQNGKAAIAVSRAVDDNYGHAGPAFVARLLDVLKSEGGRERLVKRHAYWAEKLKGGNELSGRRAPFVGALALAAELAQRWDITPGLTPPSNQEWQSLITVDDQTDNRPEMALDAAVEWIASNNFALWYPGTVRREPAGGWIGRTIKVGDRWTVAVMPGRLKSALDRVGITLDTVLPAWKENGWLLKGNEKDRPWDPKKRIGASTPRLFTFHPDQVGGDYGSDPDPRPRDGYVPYADAE